MQEMFSHPIVAWGLLLALLGAVFWGGKVQEHKGTVHAFMKEIRADIKKILGILPAPTTVPGSPIRLTDLGDTISEELGGKQWAKEISGRLVDRHKGLSAYEIQERCFKYAKRPDSLTDELTSKVLDSAYKHGLPKDKVLDVLGVELRDNVLTKLGRMDELP